MLTQTNYSISLDKIQEALNHLPDIDFRIAINEPTGNFFYDPWNIKKEFKGTPWEFIYNSLPEQKGEARIIKLLSGQCYTSHADMDDRYHLNLSGNNCYLINLDNQQMIKLSADGYWYNMNAGARHTATNFGNRTRYQIVVRQLFTNNVLSDPVGVKISANITDQEDARFIFDDTISPWLNIANKAGKINNFSFSGRDVMFDIDRAHILELSKFVPAELKLTIK